MISIFLHIRKSWKNLSLSAFILWFSFFSDQHDYKTSGPWKGSPNIKTNRYEKYSVAVSAIELWNKIQKQLKNMLLKVLPTNKIKTIVSNFYLNWQCKIIIMTLLVPKNIQGNYFSKYFCQICVYCILCCHLIVSVLLTLLFKTFKLK